MKHNRCTYEVLLIECKSIVDALVVYSFVFFGTKEMIWRGQDGGRRHEIFPWKCEEDNRHIIGEGFLDM